MQGRLATIGDRIWLCEGGIASFYGFAYPTRSVIVSLPDGQLWVRSPVALDEDLRRVVEAHGQVAYFVSPNEIHGRFLASWQRAFPQARLWGPLHRLAPSGTVLRATAQPYAAALVQAFSVGFLQQHWSWWQRPLARLDGLSADNPDTPRERRASFLDRRVARSARTKVRNRIAEAARLFAPLFHTPFRLFANADLAGARDWILAEETDDE